MPVTVRGTDILFNDGTTQSTAAGLAPAFGAIGSTMIVYYANTLGGVGEYTVTANTTIAGTSLRYNPTAGTIFPSSSGEIYVGGYGTSWPGGGTALSGTWRVMGNFRYANVQNICGYVSWYYQIMVVRVS